MASKYRPKFRTVLSRVLRRIENKIDELEELDGELFAEGELFEWMELRGIVASLLQWEIEAGHDEDIPF